jgi:hypothetical protein
MAPVALRRLAQATGRPTHTKAARSSGEEQTEEAATLTWLMPAWPELTGQLDAQQGFAHPST